MIEDESGRMQLIGDRLKTENLVTGVIVGALGMETGDGGFEVADLCYAGMPPQEADLDVPPLNEGEDKMDIDVDSRSPIHSHSRRLLTRVIGDHEPQELVAFVSGILLDDENCYDVNMAILAEFLVGELDVKTSSRISRLVIAGNSLAPITLLPPEDEEIDNTKSVSHFMSIGSFQLNDLKLCL
jgi:DNA polymerase delta subunit 2